MNLSARACHRILKLAHKIVDLDGRENSIRVSGGCIAIPSRVDIQAIETNLVRLLGFMLSILLLVLYLLCPANKSENNQAEGQWNENSNIAITIRAEIVHRIYPIQCQIPHRDV